MFKSYVLAGLLLFLVSVEAYEVPMSEVLHRLEMMQETEPKSIWKSKPLLNSSMRSFSWRKQNPPSPSGHNNYKFRSYVKPYHPMRGYVPIIPPGDHPPWVPGELIAVHITPRELRKIDESEFGPLVAVTKFPKMYSTILVFPRKYHPERLSEVLKSNLGVDTSPNGVIQAYDGFYK